MSYPAITPEEADRVADAVREATQKGRDPMDVVPEPEATVEERDGADYDRSAVERFSVEMKACLLPGVGDDELAGLARDKRTELEAEMADPTYRLLCDHEIDCLQDPDFWRYLALFPLRWYSVAREPELQPQDYGGTVAVKSDSILAQNKRRRVDMKKQVVFRTFLWGQAAQDGAGNGQGADSAHERATVLSKKEGGPSLMDVWHSHIIRPQIGHLGEIPQAFVDVVSTDPMPTTDEARELAKLLTRMKNTVALDAYGYEEARSLVEEQLEFARRRLAAKNSPN